MCKFEKEGGWGGARTVVGGGRRAAKARAHVRIQLPRDFRIGRAASNDEPAASIGHAVESALALPVHESSAEAREDKLLSFIVDGPGRALPPVVS